MTRELHQYGWWHPKRALGRMLGSVLLGVIAIGFTPEHIPMHVRGVVSWDVFALCLNAMAWSFIIKSTPEQTRKRAAANDPGRTLVWVVALASSLVSLFAGAFVLREVRNFEIVSMCVWSAFGLLAVVLSWTLTHTAYTLRYAHLYYRGASVGGLEFPGGEPPAEIDFAYFSFTLGMCFQVSDVTVSSSEIRRAVLLHALLSFLYNTTIVALALNVAFSLLN